jgi:alpha-galactosidase
MAVIKRLIAGHYNISADARGRLSLLMAIQEYRVPWMRHDGKGDWENAKKSHGRYGPALDPFAKVKALQTLQTKRFGISSLTLLVFVGCTFVALSQTPTLAPVVVPDLAPILTAPDFWRADAVPFSFKYGGKDSAEILPTWQTTQETVAGETGQLQRYSYTDPVTHLRVTAEVRLYPEFPGVVDWVLLFRNDGTTDTPIIENIMPLRWAIPAVPGDLFVRHAQGSNNSADDFTPMLEHFGPWGEDHLKSKLGRSSDTTTLPFFNLQNGDHGLIEAIGWTGNWKADFTYSRDRKNITMDSGMKETHLLLHPGEEIRTPRIVLMSWKGGTWQEAQNRWRRLLFAHYTPQENGKPMRGPVMFGSWGSEPIADKLAFIQWVHDHKIPVNMYAVDAGWYGDSVGTEMVSTNPWWKNRGDWFPSKLDYPNGIKPLGDALKADGIGFSLWIEPETTMPDMKIAKDHPDWFIQKPIPPMFKNPSFLADLGNPAARKGLTDMVSDFITDFGMTWYRQDFNQEPEKFWRAGDTPDRIGMTEIKHIEGLYQMWDELLARHPGLRIDNCASGGRRLDIEMMSRSFSVWRTDNGFYDTIAEQEQTQDLAFWVPENMGFETYTAGLNGAPLPWTTTGPYTTTEHLYLMRLGYDVGYGIRPGAAGVNNDAWVAWIKQALGEYHEVQPYFYGDFYPLLPSSRDVESWTVWQWDRPESKDGLIMVLRRPKSPFLLMEVRPQHLNADATYEVEVRTTYDKGPVKKMKGSELAHLQIHMPEAPSSTLIFYREK